MVFVRLHVQLYMYRSFRANFTYDVIPIALFQAQIYVTLANEVQMWNSHLRGTGMVLYQYTLLVSMVPDRTATYCSLQYTLPVPIPRSQYS